MELTGSSSITFHSGLRVLRTVCVTTRASPRVRTMYCRTQGAVLVGSQARQQGTRWGQDEESGRRASPRLGMNSRGLRCHHGLWQQDSLPAEGFMSMAALGGTSRGVRGSGKTYLNNDDFEGEAVTAHVPDGTDGISLGTHFPLLARPWGAVRGFVGEGGGRGGGGGGEMEVVGGEEAARYDAHHVGKCAASCS